MRDLKLDPTTGDLAISPSGQLALTGAPGAVTVDAVRQKLQIRLSLFLGEYVLDSSKGTPWIQQILGKVPQSVAEGILRQSISTCPGVATLLSFAFTVGANRQGSLSFTVKTVAGDVLTIKDFQPTQPGGL